jgi:bifunctional non-homologous end joining protein LigD
VSWNAVIAAAKDVRDRLNALGLTSFLKTSGGKGLHVVVPIEPRADWDEAKAFTAALAAQMASDHPDKYIATLAKRARHGRILIDYLRNGRGATAVAAYSTRGRANASVSTPIEWDEISEGLKSDHYTVDNLGHRLKFLKRDPWEGFFTIKQRLPAKSAR